MYDNGAFVTLKEYINFPVLTNQLKELKRKYGDDKALSEKIFEFPDIKDLLNKHLKFDVKIEKNVKNLIENCRRDN